MRKLSQRGVKWLASGHTVGQSQGWGYRHWAQLGRDSSGGWGGTLKVEECGRCTSDEAFTSQDAKLNGIKDSRDPNSGVRGSVDNVVLVVGGRLWHGRADGAWLPPKGSLESNNGSPARTCRDGHPCKTSEGTACDWGFKVEASFKLSLSWGQSWSSNKAARDSGNVSVNSWLRGEPRDSFSLLGSGRSQHHKKLIPGTYLAV